MVSHGRSQDLELGCTESINFFFLANIIPIPLAGLIGERPRSGTSAPRCSAARIHDAPLTATRPGCSLSPDVACAVPPIDCDLFFENQSIVGEEWKQLNGLSLFCWAE